MSHVRRDPLSDIDRALLARFDLGECNAEEEVLVNELLANVQDEGRFRQMLPLLTDVEVEELSVLEQSTALKALQARLSQIDTAYAMQEVDGGSANIVIIDTRIGISSDSAVNAVSPPMQGGRNVFTLLTRLMPQSSWSMVTGMALGVILLISGWYGGMTYLNMQTTEDMSVYTTANGQRSTVTLSDGSVVVLNVGSRLEVPVNYANGNRALHLSGEALFTVTHQDRSPFTVMAGPSTTRVLGTSFIVRHYPSDTTAIIAVRDGKVMVQSTVLTAMQQVAVDFRGTSTVRPTSHAPFSFASGVLMLNGVLLPDAISQLNRWYDVDIRLGDATLFERELVGGFKAGSLTDLSSILELMLDVYIVRTGRTLTLYPRK